MQGGLSPVDTDLAAALTFALRALELDQDPAELRTGTWRLLLATDPPALQRLVEETVGPAGDPLDTLRAYITHGASVSATAAAVYAHRHTISNRLERLRSLTGHDPQTPAGQTQLALGLQALEIREAISQRR